MCCEIFFFFSSRRRHTRFDCDWSSDVCSSDLGQAGSSSLIENFFGFPTGVGGGELTWLAQLQAYRFGAKFSTPSQALSLNYDADGEYRVCLETEGCSAILRAKTVLIATGADYRRLNAEGREQFENMGVYYAATAMEGQLCRNETVVIAGIG